MQWTLLKTTAIAVAAAVTVLTSGCGSDGPAPPPASLPVPKTGEVTFYLSLPASTAALDQAATKTATAGSATYRDFLSPATAASRFGATDTQIDAIAASVRSLGLQYAADPTRLFARVTGSVKQWQAALGTPLTEQAATASNPFTTYILPAKTPAALHPPGSVVLLNSAQVYDPAAEGRHPSPGNGLVAEAGTKPWPRNTGTPFTSRCSALALQLGEVYTEQQGDGVPAAVSNANPETSLDLQTAAAVAPKAQFRLVQATPGGGILDGFSRALSNPGGVPDVISLS